MKFEKGLIVITRMAAALLLVSSSVSFGSPALADPVLEQDFSVYLAEGVLKTPLSIKSAGFARTLSEKECSYQAELADLSLDAVSAGMTLEGIKASNQAAGEPIMLEDFIARQQDFKSSGVSANVRARIVLEVHKACIVAAEAWIASIE